MFEDSKRLTESRTKHRRGNGKDKKEESTTKSLKISKGEIGNRKSKNKQCNDQMKKDKGTNNDPQITTETQISSNSNTTQ